MRQALGFGMLSSVVGLAALLWPLVLSTLVGNVVATLWIYGLAMLIDLALLVLWIVLALRYSQRAGRGELFDVPWVARLTGTSVRK
ncbi:MAG TPA: hypothetical protein VK702_06240 [Candidatus Acidoferrum sp.]|jgi:hypothetical protein|nr:hypothetical protein [Candidatus Acidoferrum sp.]